MPCICCGSNELHAPPEGDGEGGKGECKGTGAVRALEPLVVVKEKVRALAV